MPAMPATGDISNDVRTVLETKTNLETIRDAISTMVGGALEEDLTIATAIITPTTRDSGGCLNVDTESAASTDDLETIAQTNTHDGQNLFLRAADGSRTVVVKDAIGGTGQILTMDSQDFDLDDADKWIWLRRVGTSWIEVSRSNAADMDAARSFAGGSHKEFGFEFTNEALAGGQGVEITAGQCWDTTRAYLIVGAAMNKQISGLWVVGDTQGAWDVGTAPANEGCYWYAIRKDSDASVDYVCSLSETWAGVTKTRLSGYTYGQKLMYTVFNGSNALFDFWQYGDTVVGYPGTIVSADAIVTHNIFQDYINVYAPAYSLATITSWGFDPTSGSGAMEISLAAFDTGYDGQTRANSHILSYIQSATSVTKSIIGQGRVPLNGDRKFLATASESVACTLYLYANQFTMTDRFNSAS